MGQGGDRHSAVLLRRAYGQFGQDGLAHPRSQGVRSQAELDSVRWSPGDALQRRCSAGEPVQPHLDGLGDPIHRDPLCFTFLDLAFEKRRRDACFLSLRQGGLDAGLCRLRPEEQGGREGREDRGSEGEFFRLHGFDSWLDSGLPASHSLLPIRETTTHLRPSHRR